MAPPGQPKDGPGRAKAIAISLLARHGWSTAKLRERLLRRGVPEGAADATIAELTRAGLLGDRAFAEDAAKLELSRRPAADAFLEHKLTAKGVPETLASKVAADAAEGVSELDRARNLARRSARPDPKDPAAARRRLLGLLARRGFDAETSHQAVEEVLGREPESAEHDSEIPHDDPFEEHPDEPV